MNRLIKRLCLAVTGLSLSITPSFASTTRTTADLLQLMDDSGITIVFNGPRCNSGIDGAYQWTGIARRMILCIDDQVDANDHNTVRHETIHAIQHCKNTVYGRPATTPLMEPEQVVHVARNVLTFDEITAIKRMYPQDQWLVELEAFSGAKVLDAEDLMAAFEEWCLMEA